MTTPLKQTQLRPPKAPNLLIAPVDYTQTYQDQMNNALRLYFNEIDNFGFCLTNNQNGGGGSLLVFPNGAFHQDGTTTLSANITNNSTTPISVASTASFPSGGGYILIGTEIIQYTTATATTFDGTITRGALGTTNVAHTAGAQVSEVQATGSPTTIGKILFNNTDASNGVSINPADTSQVVFSVAARYNVQISLQLLSFSNSPDNVTVWFAQNGVDIPNTASIATVPAIHGGVPGANIMAFNVYVDVNPNDYIQVKWTSDSGNSVVATYPAGLSPVHPVSPAIILTAQFVSAVY